MMLSIALVSLVLGMTMVVPVFLVIDAIARRIR
jgi:hypothetical protein